jgi:hypothetical protein
MDENDIEQKEPPPNPKTPPWTIHRNKQFLNIDADPSLDLLPNPFLNPIKFPISYNS